MSPERPVYQTPGVIIRRAREARGFSLQDLSAETRIPDRLLSAIENDDFDKLSGTLYVRSFLRNCGQSLGIDPGVLLDSYARMLTEAEPEIPTDQTWEKEVAVQRVGVVPWRRVGVIVAALLLAVLLVWVVIRLIGSGDDSPPSIDDGAREPAGSVEAAAVDTLSVVVADTVAVSEPGGGEQVRVGTSEATIPPATEETAEEVPVPDTAGRVVEPGPSDQAVMGSLPPGTPDLVFAGGETWPLVLRVVTDRRLDFAVGSVGDRQARDVPWPDPVPQGVPAEGVTPGRIHAVAGRYVAYWGAADHFLLKLSRADGVTVTLNGRSLAVPARIVGREWVLDRSLLE